MRSTSLFALAALALGLIAASSYGCDDVDVETCEVDDDCQGGAACRDGACVATNVPEAGVDGASPQPACVNVGASCSLDGDCCSNRCAVNRCADPSTSSGGSSGKPGSSSSSSGGTTCVDLYGACLAPADCCFGLDCLTGVCR